MKRPGQTQTSNELVVLNELSKSPDGSTMIGNSIEVPYREAVLLVQTGKAKFLNAPIGVVPGSEQEKVVEAEAPREETE